MIRQIDLAFIKLHILYHASKEEVYGVGLVQELARHGYKLSFGTLYPSLAKMVRMRLLIFETITVNHKQRKYYRITPRGLKKLDRVRASEENHHAPNPVCRGSDVACPGGCHLNGYDTIG